MAEATFYNLIDELERYLEYQRDEGVKRLEVDRCVLAEIARPVTAPVPAEPEGETAPPVPGHFGSLEEIAACVAGCRGCPLWKTRRRPVPGEGKADRPDILFVGEGPGADEDAQGRPFVGRAGQLLTRMIEAMGYTRDEVFIANIVKCRPPGNRTPRPEEMQACIPYLREQIRLLRPRVIVGMGSTAVRGLLGPGPGISRLRGTWQEYGGIRLMPTFHPSYLLRDPSKKKPVWEDLKQVLEELGRPPPRSGKKTA